MPRRDEAPSSETRLIRLTLSKLQIGLMAAGLAALLAAAFGLGSLLGGREADERAAAPGRTTVVRLDPPPAPAAGEAVPPDPQFYKDLTAPPRPFQEASPSLIRLPDGKEPPKSPAREAQEPPAVRVPPPEPEGAAPREEARPQAPAPAAPRGEVKAPEPPFSKDGPPKFTIQVLSAREPGQAERLLRELLRRGIPAYIERADLGPRGVWHRVRVGRFWSRASAEQTLQDLRRKAVRGASVVPL
ncbi:MAG: SPOR domain-containing protein [Candidatus Tectomicrobia bacterium]|uniref:SPOR domain-containing protein n=1 Tax=Tectimicrobiota bacterium TaxID=2528274 RepID=A0A932MN96_UNCTE|nr:SPOR domain-containing protein [Candidatus Tectomicrobia bacterium]